MKKGPALFKTSLSQKGFLPLAVIIPIVAVLGIVALGIGSGILKSPQNLNPFNHNAQPEPSASSTSGSSNISSSQVPGCQVVTGGTIIQRGYAPNLEAREENKNKNISSVGSLPAPNAIKDEAKQARELINQSPLEIRQAVSDAKVDIGKLSDYQLILRNVPVKTEDLVDFTLDDEGSRSNPSGENHVNIVLDKIKIINGKKYYPLYFKGHATLHYRSLDSTKNDDPNKIQLSEYGLLLYIQLNANNEPVMVSGENIGVSENLRKPYLGLYFIADVYQDLEFLSARPLPEAAIKECLGSLDLSSPGASESGVSAGPQVIVPSQSKSNDQTQLQLEYFVFDDTTVSSGGGNGAWDVHCKPAIYLYPPKKELVNVKVFPSGFLSYVDPPYDFEKGWTVLAEPNGQLQTNNESRITNHEYLYYESKIYDSAINKPVKGWVMKYDELESLYRDILPKLGLNGRQTQDFIEYWKKALPYSPYYFVGIIDRDNVNQIERLEITPRPDYINRVRVYFERLDSPKQVEAPELSKFGSWNLDLGTSTFKVVEWGGMVKNDPEHPFTCSQ